VWNSWK